MWYKNHQKWPQYVLQNGVNTLCILVKPIVRKIVLESYNIDERKSGFFERGLVPNENYNY